MARCGCKPSCTCTITGGKCATVSGGSGLPGDPKVVDVIEDNTTVFCQGGILTAKLNIQDTPTVDLSGDGTAATPLKADVILTPNGQVPDPDGIGTGNMIKLGPTGIYLSCEDVQDCVGAAITAMSVSDCLQYDDPTNTISVRICGNPNGLQCLPAGSPGCPAGGLSVTPSTDPGNALKFGTDGNLFAAGSAIQAGNCTTITGTGTTADPFTISPQVAPAPNGLKCIPGTGLSVVPSTDPNNGLVFGTDGRLWVNNCPYQIGNAQILFGPASGPCFELQGDGCNTPLVATLRISSFPCNGLVCRPDGLYVEADTTPLPAVSTRTDDTPGFPGLGPFNGSSGPIVVAGPDCVSITNPSPCRDMISTGGLSGFLDVGRQSGFMQAQMEVADNPGGPWTAVAFNGQQNPEPPSRITTNAAWEGNVIVLAPGASRQVCVRTVVQFNAVNTGRLFFSERTLTLTGKWAS